MENGDCIPGDFHEDDVKTYEEIAAGIQSVMQRPTLNSASS